MQKPPPKSRSSLSGLSQRALKVLGNAINDDKKRRVKGAKSRRFDWADFNGYYDDPLLPPSEAFLVNYVSASMAGKISEATARKHMRLLKHDYEMRGYEWQGGTLLGEAIKGAKKMRPPSSIRPERDPVTKERLDIMEQNLDLGDDYGIEGDRHDIAIMACITTAFYGQARLGEVLSMNSSPSEYNHLTHPVTATYSGREGVTHHTIAIHKKMKKK
ncbi:hypothetical protein AAF712_014906 [Marasmius tenuissimus]|uniref:Uncharacterized protein n=1 Tax=Marasmius tenuissimus TaxID=585030 RepID=A0ABR2ZBV1_9AGAR